MSRIKCIWSKARDDVIFDIFYEGFKDTAIFAIEGNIKLSLIWKGYIGARNGRLHVHLFQFF